MINNIYQIVIGSGAMFPIQLGTNDQGKTGWYPVVGDPALISQNLIALINYMIGQRFRQEEFGTRLWECIEEPNTQAQEFMVYSFLKEAIAKYENRISLQKSSVSRIGSQVKVCFSYLINTTNTSGSGSIIYDSISNTTVTT